MEAAGGKHRGLPPPAESSGPPLAAPSQHRSAEGGLPRRNRAQSIGINGALKRAVTLAALAALGVDAEVPRPVNLRLLKQSVLQLRLRQQRRLRVLLLLLLRGGVWQDGLPSDGEDDCVACCSGAARGRATAAAAARASASARRPAAA